MKDIQYLHVPPCRAHWTELVWQGVWDCKFEMHYLILSMQIVGLLLQVMEKGWRGWECSCLVSRCGLLLGGHSISGCSVFTHVSGLIRDLTALQRMLVRKADEVRERLESCWAEDLFVPEFCGFWLFVASLISNCPKIKSRYLFCKQADTDDENNNNSNDSWFSWESVLSEHFFNNSVYQSEIQQ